MCGFTFEPSAKREEGQEIESKSWNFDDVTPEQEDEALRQIDSLLHEVLGKRERAYA